MKKTITICFRTTEELKGALEAAASKDHRSLSSVIELILTGYVKDKSVSLEMGRQERRRYPRKQVALPAYVRRGDSEYGAVITDLSLGGIRISVPAECASRIYKGQDKSRFETSFSLPAGKVTVLCKPERTAPTIGNVDVGATFADADFATYQRIQQYLM